MAILVTEDFEGAADGANATAATTTFDGILGNAGVITHSTLQSISGTRSLRINGSLYSDLYEDFTDTGTIYVRLYFKLAGSVPANAYFIQGSDANGTTNPTFQIGIKIGDLFRLRNGTTEVATSSAVTLNQWYRVDLSITTPTMRCRVYTGATIHSSTTTDAWWDSGSQTFSAGTTTDRIYLGNIIAVTGGWEGFIDYVEMDNASLPAPYFSGPGITDYIIQYRTTTGPGAWQTFSDSVTDVTGVTVTGLANSTSYDFRVASVNAAGNSPWSNIATATTSAAGTLNIYVGDSQLQSLALGDVSVTKAYLGDVLVFES